MDIKTANTRRQEFDEFNILDEFPKYDYAKEGVLTKSLPKIMFKGNSILVTFIQFIDLKCIMLLKYIDKLKRFKWISWY